jgi:hypothetical protein
MFVLENKMSIFLNCRSSHLVTGTAFIVVANFVGWLMEVQTKLSSTMILLCLHCSHAIYVRKNVRPYNLFF